MIRLVGASAGVAADLSRLDPTGQPGPSGSAGQSAPTDASGAPLPSPPPGFHWAVSVAEGITALVWDAPQASQASAPTQAAPPGYGWMKITVPGGAFWAAVTASQAQLLGRLDSAFAAGYLVGPPWLGGNAARASSTATVNAGLLQGRQQHAAAAAADAAAAAEAAHAKGLTDALTAATGAALAAYASAQAALASSTGGVNPGATSTVAPQQIALDQSAIQAIADAAAAAQAIGPALAAAKAERQSLQAAAQAAGKAEFGYPDSSRPGYASAVAGLKALDAALVDGKAAQSTVASWAKQQTANVNSDLSFQQQQAGGGQSGSSSLPWLWIAAGAALVGYLLWRQSKKKKDEPKPEPSR